MASLAERYSTGISGARAFVPPLHVAASRPHLHHASIATRMCVVVWRAIALMLLSNPLSLAVPLTWIASPSASHNFIVVTDAGPFGSGIAIFNLAHSAVAHASFRLPFEGRAPGSDPIKESRFQNIREFMGAILALICINHLSTTSCQILWVNYNMSALAWVRDDMSSSLSARWAFLSFTCLSLLGHVKIYQVEHIPGVNMGVVDALSRFLPTPELLGSDSRVLDLPTEALSKLFLSSDPTDHADTPSCGNTMFPSW